MTPTSSSEGSRPWWHEMNRYHWFVLVVAALGWLFDCLDQQLFTISRSRAMAALVPGGDAVALGGKATMIFLLGWACGGLFFGMLGDRIGRAKTMMITILMYSGCTGLSAFSTGFWDFAFYRFLTGLGVGGEFAVGVALVAEVMPSSARAGALGLLQSLSAVGNVTAAMLGFWAADMEAQGKIPQGQGWRVLFVVGALPALLAVLVRMRMKEPEKWVKAKESGELAKRSSFTYSDLFSDPRWTRHALLGLLLACSGVIGLWGIGFFSPELVRSVLGTSFAAQNMPKELIATTVDKWAAYGLAVQQVGAFFGMLTFTWLAQKMGRRPAFALGFVLAALATVATFLGLHEKYQVFIYLPIMGFCQLSVFAIYAIYLPELFPTHLRSTGTSFCYNVGRFVAAFGPYIFGKLKTDVFASQAEPLRYAGATMCVIFLVGLAVLPFLPETKGKPLPE